MIIYKIANEICPTWETIFPSEESVVKWGIVNCPDFVFEILKGFEK